MDRPGFDIPHLGVFHYGLLIYTIVSMAGVRVGDLSFHHGFTASIHLQRCWFAGRFGAWWIGLGCVFLVLFSLAYLTQL